MKKTGIRSEVFVYIILFVLSAVFLAPIVIILINSVKNNFYISDSPFTLPDGSIVEYNYKTIEKWVSMYQRGGLEALNGHCCSLLFLIFAPSHWTVYMVGSVCCRI